MKRPSGLASLLSFDGYSEFDAMQASAPVAVYGPQHLNKAVLTERGIDTCALSGTK